MTRKCVVPNCRLQEDDRGCKILHFRKFPKNEDHKKIYFTALKEEFGDKVDAILKLKKLFICDLHFNEDCFYRSGKGKNLLLRRESIPLIFTNFRPIALKAVVEKYENIDKFLSNNIVSNNDEKTQSFSYQNDENNKSAASTCTANNDENIYLSSSDNLDLTRNNEEKCLSIKIILNNDQKNISEEISVVKVPSSEDFNNLVMSNEEHLQNDSICSDANKSSISHPTVMSKSNTRIIHQDINNSSSQCHTDLAILSYSNNIDGENSKHKRKSFREVDLKFVDYYNITEVKKLLKKAKSEVLSQRNIIMKQRREIKNLRMQVYRYKAKVKNIKLLITRVKDRKFITEKVASILEGTLSETEQELFECLLNKQRTTKPFPDALKNFAATLQYYSPKGYNYVRNTFLKNLPHPITVHKWHRNIQTSTGINAFSIEAIKNKVKMKKENETLCAATQ